MERQRVQVDPAVAAVLQDADRRSQRREMSQKQRKQAQRDEKRVRMTLELDPRVARMIGAIAVAEEVSPAGATNLLIVEAVQRYVEGVLEFEGQRQPSRSPRYVFMVELNGRVAELERQLDEFVKEGKK